MSEDLNDILACPKCHNDIERKDNYYVCDNCRLKFPIEDGIPNFLVDEAESF